MAGPSAAQGKGKGKRGRAEAASPEGQGLRVRLKLAAGAEAGAGAGAEDEWGDSEGEEDSEEEELGRPLARYDFSDLALKADHANRPLWVCPDGHIFLESFSPLYQQAYDFLIAVAEPLSRPEHLHEYKLTSHSLYAAVSYGLTTETIAKVLDKLSKSALPEKVRAYIMKSTTNYGKVKLVLEDNKFYIESADAAILHRLLEDDVIKGARVAAPPGPGGGFLVAKGLREKAATELAKVADAVDNLGKGGAGDGGEDEEALAALRDAEGAEGGPGGPPGAGPRTVVALEEEVEADGGDEALQNQLRFEIRPSKVEHVKQRCLPSGLNYPIIEEYDFLADRTNADLNIELSPKANLRPYQEKSLSKMFSNGRARSGVIVLPCGAGKSLTGVAAAARIKKSVLVLCTNAVSVDQWKYQFMLWTNLQSEQISSFTANKKEQFKGDTGVVVTTYSMLAFGGRRSEEAARILTWLQSREWGCLLLDEVHVFPADTVRKVIAVVKAHCKLGLTATLIREDTKIQDLHFLVGPKMYEANWLDLVRDGHLANVQCVEVWCAMTKEFFRAYLKEEKRHKRELLWVLNPIKFMTCQFLVEFHERRGDKILVFSDDIFALREYATKLKRYFIYGATSHQERTDVLQAFKNPTSQVNTVFISRIGDNSIDIPEANVIIQVDSLAGSRRQEAQRLGRILRPKQGAKPRSATEFNAFFYSLVSNDTQEMFHSSKRQQFLIDQGYAFKVVTNLLAGQDLAQFAYSTWEDQCTLLSKIMAYTPAKDAARELPDEIEGAAALGVSRQIANVRRTVGSLAGLSGAEGIRYMEYSTGAAGGRPKPAPRRSGPKHFLFRRRSNFQR